MEEALFAGCRKRSIPLIADSAFGLVDPDHGDTNRMSAATFNLDDLIAEIVYHPIDLLNHRLRQHLHFNTDFDGSYRSSGHKVARIGDGSLTRDDFAEGSIAAPGRNAAPLVLDV